MFQKQPLYLLGRLQDMKEAVSDDETNFFIK